MYKDVEIKICSNSSHLPGEDTVLEDTKMSKTQFLLS